MLTRRTFNTTSALAATMAMLPGVAGAASKAAQPPVVNIAPRGQVGRLKRMPKLDQESKLDFLVGMGIWTGSSLSKAAAARAATLAKTAGIDDNVRISVDAAKKLLGGDPVVGMRDVMWQSVHNYCNAITYDAFHENGEAYLAEMEAHDNIGPGSLKLDTALEVPEWARHEIHQQPGGYVGDPFAGHMYHADTNQFYGGKNDQDERHASYAAATPLPADGQVKRILDMGSGIGQLTVALKDRFLEAEVHGIDVAAPMLRYAHMRAVNLKSDVHFSQQLAEKTNFPDNHFDIVATYIMFHEMPGETTKQVLKEVARILRPGGVFFPLDFNGQGFGTPYGVYASWFDHRWNSERWRFEFANVNMDEELRKLGFSVDDQSEAKGIFGKIVATKTV
jgi:ubiquinone/menaquinone biosynthesis C-methylase UbiE